MSCRRIAQQLKNWVVSDNQWRSAADDANLWLAAVNARTATKWVSVTSWDNQFRSVNSSRRNGKKGQVLLMITKHENNIPLLHDQVTPKMTLILYSTEEIEWNQITHSWASQQIMSYRHRISDGTRIRSPVWGTKHKTAQKIKIYVRFICQILAGAVHGIYVRFQKIFSTYVHTTLSDEFPRFSSNHLLNCFPYSVFSATFWFGLQINIRDFLVDSFAILSLCYVRWDTREMKNAFGKFYK